MKKVMSSLGGISTVCTHKCPFPMPICVCSLHMYTCTYIVNNYNDFSCLGQSDHQLVERESRNGYIYIYIYIYIGI